MKLLGPTVLLFGMLIVACSPTGSGNELGDGKPDDHLTCAAMISAADQLIVTARISPDQGMLRDGLLASMSHVNAWAIPNNLPEKQAFDDVKKERQRLLSSLAHKEIVARARACIDQTKAVNVR